MKKENFLKKVSLTFFILAALYSCDGLEYSGETKYVFQGRILDQDGEPLQGVLVSTHVSKEGSLGFIIFPGSPSDYDLISYTRTDRNGFYRMVFPKPTNQDNIAVGINADTEDAQPNEQISSTYITNIQNADIDNYLIDFGDRSLYDLDNGTTLTVSFTNAPWSLEVVPVGLVNNAIEVINTPTHQLYQPVPGGGNVTYTFEVARNQNIVLRYGNGGSFSTIEEITIPVGNGPVSQTINL